MIATDGLNSASVTFEWQITGPPPPELPGDFDGTGTVDQGDYDVWRGSFGQNVTPYTLGDGNGDGIVNAADYTVWRNHLGQSTGGAGAGGDITGPSAGVVDQADYVVWKAHFGETVGGSGAGQASVTEAASANEARIDLAEPAKTAALLATAPIAIDFALTDWATTPPVMRAVSRNSSRISSSLAATFGSAASDRRLLLATSQQHRSLASNLPEDDRWVANSGDRSRERDDLFAQLGAEPTSLGGHGLSPRARSWSAQFAGVAQ